MSLLFPQETLIKVGVTIAIIGSLYGYHYFKVTSLEKEVAQLQSVNTALTVATGVQNAEISRLNQLSADYNKLVEDAAKKNTEDRKAANKLIADIMGRAIPKDCVGAMDALKEFSKQGAQKWNQK